MRKITVNGKKYKWKVGKSYVLIKEDAKKGQKLVIPKGVVSDDDEREEDTPYYPIRPAAIAKQIIRWEKMRAESGFGG